MDVRSIITKNRIQMGLISCIKKQQFDHILNKDIIKKADISPGTFYNYYSDKNEILTEIENQILDGIKKANDKDFQQVMAVDRALTDKSNIALAEKEFKNLIDYCISKKDVITVLLSPNANMKFLTKLSKIATLETKRRLDYLFKEKYLDIEKKSEIPAPFIINIYADVVVKTIITWLQSDTTLSPHQVRHILGEVQIKSPMQLLLLLKRE